MPETIRLVREGPIARVTLARTEVHNAFNAAMIRELSAAFTELGADPGVRIVLLRAEGRSFCAGADLAWMREAAGNTFEENLADARELARMLKAVALCPKPVLGRVQGSAFGGGVGLVAACDLAVAVETATFCFSEAKLGLEPAVISPFVLRKLLPGAARRYFMTAERIPAREAREIGLISEVAGSVEEADERLRTWIEQLVHNGPEAVAACKQLVDELSGTDWDAVLERMARRIAARRASEEGREGVQAFLEKREPAWRARPEGDRVP